MYRLKFNIAKFKVYTNNKQKQESFLVNLNLE